MEFWLQRDASKFRLPLNPASYSSDTSNIVTTQTNVNGDDINTVTGKKLALYQLEFLLPEYKGKYPSENGWTYGSTQQSVMKLLQAWTDMGIFIDFIVTGDKVNKRVVIESYSFAENDGSGDVMISLTLREIFYVQVVKATASNIKSNRPRISAGSFAV